LPNQQRVETANRIHLPNLHRVETANQIRLPNQRRAESSSLGADIQAEYNLMGDLTSLAECGWLTEYERDVFGLETERNCNTNRNNY
jgi:hypothetical protein